MACFYKFILLLLVTLVRSENFFNDFNFGSDEVMIAQESRRYQAVVKPPVIIVKPTGVTNSHRPQYNLDSLESDALDDLFEMTTRRSLVKNYKSSNNLRDKEGMVRDAVLRALDRKDHVGKFAQILPIIRAMSGPQRVALASLVASQVTTPPGRTPMNLTQVRSMFGDNGNTTELMLPILLDIANLFRRAVSPGKELKQVSPTPQMLRRSFVEETEDIESTTHDTTKHRTRRIIPPRTLPNRTAIEEHKTDLNNTDTIANRNASRYPTTTEAGTTPSILRTRIVSLSRSLPDNSTLDLMADSTNQTLAQDLPVAEKLRSLNRYTDRKNSLIRRGTFPLKPMLPPATRRTTAEPSLSPIRRRPIPARKLPTTAEPTKCELFTNTLCLNSDDYPTEAIVQSIRRNKAAAGALLADFKDPGEGAIDGVTAGQESKYTADHYLVSNRRGDTANRDFASAGEAGFMCPSTVKYARPQRARATSGQWKYIVNTGEHTQTLRLEKCLKPKDACTYLTDNFKSKCVQVYNYHRLLTWDQQNGLHMDIFKVPTCCSCHIEGYSVSFPPLGHRIHETSSEHFPGEDLSSEQGNHAFEAVQSTVPRPSIKSPPFSHNKPMEPFPPFSDSQNLIPGQPFSKMKDNDDGSLPPSSPMDSYGNTYFPDSFNQASKNSRRPTASRNPLPNSFDSVTLPSYLEPPTPLATSSFSFGKDPTSKFKITSNTGNQFKRGAVRPSRRPIRKKISGGPDDLSSSGTSAVESFTSSGIEASDEMIDYLEEPEIGQASMSTSPKIRVTIAPKLHAVTTEKVSTTQHSQESRVNENFTSNGKRINYNYHPIIDFFGAEAKDGDESIDREDVEPTYVTPIESEWKPINHPPSRNNQNSNFLSKKKHK
ncbi:neurotrophin 1 [Manduca sexta]|uniref:Spaetzle domain-containing protein n=1 Tax=Manduca sexta TaxID=7130 RepID=A0A921ZLE6_MANSE|nr:neurotrophin 1 [Manduca sexta]KAG6459670.1 hypothetical protein O3G_MSEX011526 [Manduca sexta]KAG6459671.1 hypothetical protein O3G_MSEX011526 [Manduca sexta]